jgi:hypothetical protein
MISQGKSSDIALFLKRLMARERAVYRTRAQLRRLRVFSLPAGGASTPAASDGTPVTPVGCFIAAPLLG